LFGFGEEVAAAKAFEWPKFERNGDLILNFLGKYFSTGGRSIKIMELLED